MNRRTLSPVFAAIAGTVPCRTYAQSDTGAASSGSGFPQRRQRRLEIGISAAKTSAAELWVKKEIAVLTKTADAKQMTCEAG
jgi:hypothetical protein